MSRLAASALNRAGVDGPLSAADHIPSGTVTLLFTDVEGSTRLWESEPEAMAQALRRHEKILRESISAEGGYVFKTAGDSFSAAFSTPRAALYAALGAQRMLLEEPWPTSRAIRVRMALHTGACEERDGDYFGPVVNRAARLEAVAHGGQLVVSGATAELLEEAPLDAVRLRDLGFHRLRDLGRPEQVFQVEADFLPSVFPPLRSLDSPELAHNLPSLLSPFVGRQIELTKVRELLGESRLVTLTGPGGSGKTRLALHVAADLLDSAADGVWFVELAPVADPEQLPAAVAAVLGVKQEGHRSLRDSLLDALSDQRALIILDNCEHLVDASAALADLVTRRCPNLRLLATSREPLGVDGERVYRVPSLSLPPAGPTRSRSCSPPTPSACSPSGRGPSTRLSPSTSLSPPWSPRSAAASTASRSPWSWPRLACPPCRLYTCTIGWINASAC
jgi:class 3 adenylate cyclase